MALHLILVSLSGLAYRFFVRPADFEWKVWIDNRMPSKQKINLEKVQAALNTLCPKCGYVIQPAEIRRYDFNTMKCPACDEHFVVTKDKQA